MLAEQQLFITQLGIQAEHIGLQNLELKFGNNDLDYGTRHQHKIWEGKVNDSIHISSPFNVFSYRKFCPYRILTLEIIVDFPFANTS